VFCKGLNLTRGNTNRERRKIAVTVLARIGISVLMMLLLTVGVSYGQSSGKEFYDKGIEYATQGKYKEAKESFEKALKDDPFVSGAESCLKIIEDVTGQKIKSDTAIHIFKGTAYANRGMIDDAITECSKAIEINPRYAKAYNNRGIAYYYKGQYDRAIQDYSKAIEINPMYAEAYMNQGTAYYHKGKYDRAIQDYSKAIEINPRDAEAYMNRGIAYYHKGQYDRAMQDYNKAIEINLWYASAYYNRGVVYLMKLGDKKKGCSDWELACELGQCPNNDLARDYCK
jgi:tetratricopeptide (TPR) repeat protein